MKQFLDDLAVRQKETHEWIRAGKLKAPTLIMWGYNDPSANYNPLGPATINLIFPNVSKSQMHVLNQAGHYCYREQPEAFVDVVTNFGTTEHVVDSQYMICNVQLTKREYEKKIKELTNN